MTIKEPLRQNPEHLLQEKEEPSKGMGMKAMSGQVVEYHNKPFPKAHPPAFEPFPKPVMQALAWGTFAGIIIGLIFAYLLLSGLLVLPGWEGLFSMTPATFYVFWAMIGAGLVGLIAGSAAVWAYPAPTQPHENQHESQPDER